MPQPHVLLITFPTQGHINPGLQLAKRLVRMGAAVTFATSISALRRMGDVKLPKGLAFTTFSDGYDDGFRRDKDNPSAYMEEFKRRGSESLAKIIEEIAKGGRPITCLVYTLLLPWAGEVARDYHIPSALLWVQPATILDIYYYYFNGYGEKIKNVSDSTCIEFEGLPLSFSKRDLPSFLLPSDPYSFVLPSFEEQLLALEKNSGMRVLVNTFDALEHEGLSALKKFNMFGIGPLMPSAFLDGKDPSDTAFGCDLFKSSNDCVEWLDSQLKASVIYISFGSISVLKKHQKEELGRALLESKRPFLWVIRAREGDPHQEDQQEEEEMSCREELEEQGMIVTWCSQVEVLSHPAVGCFVTHCGWNSTFEGLVSGVPMVGFPQWTDQMTNAKLIEEAWRTGVRLGAKNEDGVVECGEIQRCLEMVMGEGERGEELRRNASKWRDLAREAVQEGGSSDANLKAFVDEIGACA